jgi:hypothetical protein
MKINNYNLTKWLVRSQCIGKAFHASWSVPHHAGSDEKSVLRDVFTRSMFAMCIAASSRESLNIATVVIDLLVSRNLQRLRIPSDACERPHLATPKTEIHSGIRCKWAIRASPICWFPLMINFVVGTGGGSFSRVASSPLVRVGSTLWHIRGLLCARVSFQ